MNKRIKKKHKKRMCYEAMALNIVYQCAMNITKTSPTSRVSHIGVNRIYHESISIIKIMKSNKLKKFIKNNMYIIPEHTLVYFRTNPYTSGLFNHHHNNKNILTRIMVHDFNKVHDNRTYTLDYISLINKKKIYIKTISPIEMDNNIEETNTKIGSILPAYFVDDNYCAGRDIRMAFAVLPELTEDAGVISDYVAEKMRYNFVDKIDVELKKDDFLLNNYGSSDEDYQSMV